MFRLGGRQPREDGPTIRIKALTRDFLRLGDMDAVTVSEIVCADPACPGTETVILVMRAGAKTQAYKIARPIAEATLMDVAQALGVGHTGAARS